MKRKQEKESSIAQDDTLLDPEEAAAFLKVSKRTLQEWRAAGKGPEYSRTGSARGRVLYFKSALLKWASAQKVYK